MARIELAAVTKAWGDVVAVEPTDLVIEDGEFVAILGPSGCGKSTTLFMLAGLYAPTSGAIRFDGAVVNEVEARDRNVGIVFQSFHLIANMTALENVAVPLELAGERDAFERAAAELDAVGLGARKTHYPGQLSGGEQQRVAMARALAPDPAILVADEPTGNLDGETGRQIADLLFAKQRERAMTLLLVTHDTKLAERCGRVVRMRSGTIDAEQKGDSGKARAALAQ